MVPAVSVIGESLRRTEKHYTQLGTNKPACKEIAAAALHAGTPQR